MFEREERRITYFILHVIFFLNIFLIGKSKFFSFCGPFSHCSFTNCLLPRDNQVFSTWAKHQGIRGISTTEKQNKRVGVLEVPSSSFKLMKNSTYLKVYTNLPNVDLFPSLI
ncbi:hypothetical protein LOK49_LG08G01119 [Camellia lanceoleosa]|uniref:Uncharacterized protein n=1 Tax=Camellia lanceoleosa TaxID=1840588 RepID=A0ACC0GSI1_9ERIC|nr:hypothetical protein LOK49_LG08G01119 [Camellia lanceoleosa]